MVRAQRRRQRLRDARITLWSGLLLGLVLFNLLQFLVPRPPIGGNGGTVVDATWIESDPYRSARQSRRILQSQEDPPAARVVEDAIGARAVPPARVIDGDTFDWAGMRVRIADIDTPELRGACAEEVALARAATARLGDLLAEGPFELRRLGRDEDGYGRKLRVVLRRGRSIGDQLVAEGLARTWTGRREPWC